MGCAPVDDIADASNSATTGKPYDSPRTQVPVHVGAVSRDRSRVFGGTDAPLRGSPHPPPDQPVKGAMTVGNRQLRRRGIEGRVERPKS